MKLVSQHELSHRRARRRERVLKTVAVLPSLATLGNLVCGLGAVYLCLLSQAARGSDLAVKTLGSARMENLFPTFLSIAAYLIVMSMVFDGLDGRLARLARRTTEFGAQLDSLADIVSFGVAPAVLVLCIAHPDNITALSGWQKLYWRAEWVMAAVYVCCAALRLARFNVENEEDESAHMGFRGLPTPGAAGGLICVVIFHQDLLVGITQPWALQLVARLLPPFAMVLGLFMVSRFRYAHMVNTLLRGRRSFRHVVGIVILLLVGLVIQPQATIALVAVGYALSGAVSAGIRRLRGASPTASEAEEAELPTVVDASKLKGIAAADPDDDGEDTVRSAV
jgi:CDP-diacylglycerol--serine O-phosphatidyltransferase